MNKFELFCLIFFALDKQWDNTKNEILGDFLSNANPFLFSDISSANHEYYDTFCKHVKDKTIELNNSYNIALNYIEKLNISDVKEAFLKTDKNQWKIAAEKYLSTPHKGC